ncbi:hypothetical protein L1049_028391 [Liquidambar formosana]|uniref:Peptidase A1 domain-containing protein n=1 Tax=Liquidambar formosana TaxID=63359 RepID=A0AAP0WTD1_LIQFO
MDEKPFHFSSLFFFFFFFFPTVLSRSLSETPHTTILDVSASIQKTFDVLSFKPQNQTPVHQEEYLTTPPPSSSFSLQLYPRDSLYSSHHKDYRTLVLARLERDSARVDFLTTKLNLALNNTKKFDPKSIHTEIQPEGLSTPVASAKGQGSGEYISRIGIGTPPKPFSMVLDTGSDISWLQCRPCLACYQQTDPIFDPSSSSSYSPLTCDSSACRSLEFQLCMGGTCVYDVSYGDGSSTTGDLVSETASFGSSGSVPKIAIGCGHLNQGLFVGSAGLLGLGGDALSLTSQIKASSFSYCLVDRDATSSSTLDFNTPRPGDSVTAPLHRNSRAATFYYVGLTGLSVDGELLSIPSSDFDISSSGNGGIIVDSGTTITRLQTQVYNSLRDAFARKTRDLPSASGVALFDTCYDLSSKKNAKVPTVAFHFAGGKSLPLPAKNVLIPVDSDGTFCFAFAATRSSMSIIGNVQQQSIRVSFDLAKSLVGFSLGKC